MNSVPFTMKILAGFGQCEGFLKDLGNGQIAIEYQNADKIFGILKSDIKQITIHLKDLTSVTITKGWLGTTWLGVKIVLQAKDMIVLKDCPGMTQGKVEFDIARANVAAAERFVDGLHETPGE